MNLSRAEYLEYLRSDHWRTVREKALLRAGYRCEVPGCARRLKLEINHLTYERLGAERDEDIIVMCQDCHDLDQLMFGGRRRDPESTIKFLDYWKMVMKMAREKKRLVDQLIAAHKQIARLQSGKGPVR